METYLISILVIVTILLIVQMLVFVGLYLLARHSRRYRPTKTSICTISRIVTMTRMEIR